VSLDFLAGQYDRLNSDCLIVKNLGAALANEAAQMNFIAHGANSYMDSSSSGRYLREALSFEFIEGCELVLNQKIYAQFAGRMISQNGI